MSGLSREMIIHPGETLKEVLEDREMSQTELALRTGVTSKHISTILSGQKNITVSFAKKLEYALKIDADYWLNLQKDYDKELIEFDELHSITAEEISIFKTLKEVLTYLYDEKLLPVKEQIETEILELRKFFNISSLISIPQLVSTGAFRIQNNSNIDPYILFSWVQIVELLAEKIDVVSLSKTEQKQKILAACKDIKKLSKLSQKDFLPILKDKFAECGIAFVIVPAFKNSNIQGFIKTLTNGKTILGMSFRQKRADVFWFTLFHEIGHFINGDSKQKFLDFESIESEKETKANDFAKNILEDCKKNLI